MKTPRVMIAAANSGSGKTTITCALLKQLLQRKQKAVSFKCGPDYIDPMFHERVLKIPSRNLDPFFSDEEQIQALFLRDQKGNQISVIEGVMGLYDGLGGIKEEGSSYHLASILQCPIILVINAHGMGRSVIPLISGFLKYDRMHLIKGVILNQTNKMFLSVIAPEIEKELNIKVFGCFPKQEDIMLKSRHLGLVMPDEIKELNDSLNKLSNLLNQNIDVDEIIRLAKTADEIIMSEQEIKKAIYGSDFERSKEKVRIAIAKDEAFCFYYEDNLKILEDYGAKLIQFSPLHDKKLPNDIKGVILGGGYPELYAKELSQNTQMKESLFKALAAGIPSLAECGGFMYLHEKLIDDKKESYPMLGIIPSEVVFKGKLVRFGYIKVQEKNECFLAKGEVIKGHEFHYYDSIENGSCCNAVKPVSGKIWECVNESQNHFWGFPHLYYASNPAFIRHFIRQCKKAFF